MFIPKTERHNNGKIIKQKDQKSQRQKQKD